MKIEFAKGGTASAPLLIHVPFSRCGGHLRSLRTTSTGQRENDVDGCFDFDGQAVEQCGTVMPLADSIHGGFEQERRAGDVVQALHAAVSGDDGVQHDSARDARLVGRSLDIPAARE